MGETFVASRLLGSVLAASGDLLLFSVLFGVLRIRSPRLRRACLLFSILHAWAALFLATPCSLLLVRFQHDEFARWPATLRQADPWLLAAWLCPAAALSAIWIRGARKARRALDSLAGVSGEPPGFLARELRGLAGRMGMRAPGCLLLDGASGTPFVAGLFRPRLVFPAGLLSSLEGSDVRAVLAHELAHVRGRDLLLKGVLELARRVLFFNPAHGILVRKLGVEVEKLRDLEACEVLGGRRVLAEGLVRVEEACRRIGSGRIPVGAAGFLRAPRGLTEGRLLQLAERAPTSRRLRIQGLLMGMALAVQIPLAPADARMVSCCPRGEPGRVSLHHSVVSYGLDLSLPGEVWRWLEKRGL